MISSAGLLDIYGRILGFYVNIPDVVSVLEF